MLGWGGLEFKGDGDRGWALFFLEKLCGDGDGDFGRRIAAKGKAEGAVDASDGSGGEVQPVELASEDGPLRCGSDDAEEGDFRKFPEDGGKNGKVRGVAPGDGEDLGSSGYQSDGILVGGNGVEDNIGEAWNFFQPIGTGIYDINAAGEGGKDREEGLDDVAGAKDDDVPKGGGTEDFVKEGHSPAAGHCDIALEIPGEEGCGWG